MPPPSVIPSTQKTKTETPPLPQKLSKKPLARMLPEKYKDTDVKELFPEFRPNEVLRFSRLFGIKSSLKFKKWKGNKRQKAEAATPSSSSSDVDAMMEAYTSVGADGEWKFDISEMPDDPDAYAEDQAVRLVD
jgi:transcription initiation factor TFIID subunit 1